MRFFELLFIAIGLSMDAFAVSITKGLELPKVRRRDAAAVGLWFGAFQALMPLLGYFLGTRFREQIEAVDHWVAFVILAVIGINMIREAIKEAAEERQHKDAAEKVEHASETESSGRQSVLAPGTMLLLAVATSIDALAVGITFALLQVRIALAVLFIGCITFGFSFAGIYIGRAFGTRFKKGAAMLGGLILILIGLKILLEHMGLLFR